MDLIKRIVQLEDDLIYLRDRSEDASFAFGNLKEKDLELLSDCLGTFDVNVHVFRQKVLDRIQYCKDHGYWGAK